MSIASIKAGKAFYEIFAEDKTAKGLSSAEQALMRFGAKIGMIGAGMAAFSGAALTGLTAMVKSFAGAGDDITDAMNVTGLSSDFLQTLKFGAADAGVGFDALIGSITKFNNVLAKAAAKGGSVVGLDAKSLMSLSPDERIKAVADAIESIPDPAMRAKAAMEAFGKAGAKLLPAFEGGAESLNAAMADLKARGLIMSDEDRQAAAEAEGAFLSLSLVLSRVSQVIAAAVAPAFTKVMGVIQSVLETVVQFIDKNRTLVAVAAGTVVGIGALGFAFMAIGGLAIAASLATTGFTMAVAALGTVLAIVTSPVFVITAAIIACGVAAGVAAYHLDQLFNSGKGFQLLADSANFAKASILSLQTAMVAGEWSLAFEFIATSLEQAFDGAILGIKQKWADMVSFMLSSVPGEFASNIVQDINANLEDDRQAFLDSSIRLAQIMGKIATLRANSDPTKRSLPGGSSLGDAAVAMQEMQTNGVLSSSAAARLDQSAPTNAWQDKMLKNSDKQTDTLVEISGRLEDLDNLTVE
jgi:hypothetical protein